ncbi:MAG: glycerate kinase [Bacillota bacterium]
MRVVIAIDKFKGSMPARAAAAAIAAGLRSAWPEVAVEELPLSDGGEGFLDMLVQARGGTVVTVPVTGPLGEPVPARLGLLDDGVTAVVESAEACGLWRVPPGRADAWRATSRGVGELILAALEAGRRRILVGIGGTASSDGGAGLARALGVRLLGPGGQEVADGACGLRNLARIDAGGLDPRIREAVITAACDVSNPLTGPRGAAAVFGPQKGLAAGDVPVLDAALAGYARLAQAAAPPLPGRTAGGGEPLAQRPGAGAGGGIGFALAAFAGAELVSGARLALAETRALDHFRSAGLIITGEGRLDASSLEGKLPVMVARAAAELGVPVVAVCGHVALPEDRWREAGLAAAVSLAQGPATVEELRRDARRLAQAAGYRIGALLRLGAARGSLPPA